MYRKLVSAQRIIADFFPDDYPTATSPASSHLFNHVPEDKPYDRIKYLSVIMSIMYLARLSREAWPSACHGLSRRPNRRILKRVTTRPSCASLPISKALSITGLKSIARSYDSTYIAMPPGLLIIMVAVTLAGSSKWASPTSGPEAPSSESAPRHLQMQK